ncbi:GntR family transcriptional regulator [Bacillus sp. JJ1533]|uniref:GntR family transcriptional regulator n=1 Tax=Bacillus sp. JJ1533 TaxID=3122959 RepID=UPI00300047DB
MSRPMDVAYCFIKEKILDGTFKPSQKLNEIELSTSIGVSRNTVKKALLKLQQEQLVEVQSNKGANVKSYTLEEVVNYMEIREVLEVLVAVDASSNITDTEINKLSETLHKMEEHLQNNRFDEYSKLNKAFHQIIYDTCTNKQAVEMVNIIKTQLARFHIRTILVPGRNKNSYAEHRAILEALKSGDEELVAQAIKTHLSNVRKTIQEHSSLLL